MHLESKKEVFAQSLLIIASRFVIEFISIFFSCLVFILFIWFQQGNQWLTHFLEAFILIWGYVSLLVMILITTIDSIRNVQNKSLLFGILPILPFLAQTILYVFGELLFVVGIIWIVKNLLFFNNPEVIVALVVFCLTVFEFIRRTRNIINKFYTSLASTISLVKKVGNWLKSSWLGIVYLIITVCFFAISSIQLFWGLNSPFDNIPASAPELFSNTLTIVTTILAIFFAGAALIVQLMVGAYSYKFVTVIARNWIFVSNFVILVVIGLVHLALLRFGWNQDLANLSFSSSIYAILSLVVLVLGFIEYIDISKMIRIVSTNIRDDIRRSPKPKSIFGSSISRTGKASPWYQIKWMIHTYLLGNAQDPRLEELATFSHPQGFHNDLIEKTRPIFTACLKAIREDRREIALVCLDELSSIAKTYINTFGNTSSGDEFYLFLRIEFDVLFDVAIGVTNQQFTSDIVSTIIQIAKHSLILTNKTTKENHIVGYWVHFLGSSIIKSMHLERTNAQTKAVSGMIDVGKSLIEQQYYSIALVVVGKELKKVGSRTAFIKHIWGTMITERSSYGLLELLDCYLLVARQTSTHYQYFIQKICSDLSEVLSLSYKGQSHDGWAIDSISNAIVRCDNGINLSSLVSIILTDWSDQPAPTEYVLLGGIRNILFLISHSSQSALSTNDPLIENYCTVLSEMGWNIICFIRHIKDRHALESATKYLKDVVKIAGSITEYITKNDHYQGYQSFKNLSPIYASLIFFHSISEQKIFFEIYIQGLESLNNILEESIKTNPNNHANSALYSYVKLYSAWLNHFEPKSVMVSKLMSTLRKNIFLVDDFDNMGYPAHDLSESWRITLSGMWGIDVDVITNTLNDHKILADFDNLLEKKRRTKKVI